MEEDQIRKEEATSVTNSLIRTNLRPSETHSEILQSAIDVLNAAILHEDSAIAVEDGKISVLQHEINEIRERMHQLRDTRYSLTVKRSRLEDERDFYRAFRTPARLLPLDVLLEIFKYCVDENSDVIPLLSISRVCSSWRSACLGNATLWTNLSISADRYSRVWRLNPELEWLIPWWFQRTKRLPLSLTVRSTSLGLHRSDFVGLVPYLDRLSHLEIRVQYALSLVPLLVREPGSFPLLQTISLSANDRFYAPFQLYLDLSSSSHLHTVFLELRSPGEPVNIALPWDQLTHSKMQNELPSDIWHAGFCRGRNLRSASFLIETTDKPIKLPPAPITYDYLSTLELTFSIKNDLPSLKMLRNLVFPSLQELSLSTDDYWEGLPVGHLLRNTSTKSLRCLSLARVDIDIPELVEFLATCPSLENFGVDLPRHNYDYEALFGALLNGVGDMSSGPSLPKLASFATAVRVEDGEMLQPVSPRPFIDLVLSWRQSLKAVNVTVYAEPDPPDAPDGVARKNIERFLDRVDKELEPYTHDSETRPAGFVLTTTEMETEDFIYDFSPVTVNVQRRTRLKGLGYWDI
ncbi:hypothetical protein FPV67DRAFT_1670336 [Lyophyllum atratum]|nr:hypothetical protein FPV67DRAFT_1670336 [Lyophyllum atratum]